VIQLGLRAAVRTFFRRVEVTGREAIPPAGGGLIVSWHPNGLVDPGLVLTQFPRQVVFGARHGLFGWPLLGWLLRRLGTVPIYRAIDATKGDPDARRRANAKSLDALANEVARGSFSALFPEGISHDAPHLTELKTGAARLYYRARSLAAGPPPVILPVGLHYDKKQMFRSNAMVAFHPPLELPAELDVTPPADESEEEATRRAKGLTALIDRTLREVVHSTDDWQLHHLIHRARRLVRAERAHRVRADPGKSTIGERVLGFARVRHGYYTMLARDPVAVEALRARVEHYDEELRALRLEDHELDHDPRVVRPALGLALQATAVFVLLPPLIVLGWVVNLPTALLLRALARVGAKLEKDEATIKLLVGLVLFPLTWVAAGVLAARGISAVTVDLPFLPDNAFWTGVGTTIAAGTGGALAIRYGRIARETAHALRVRLTRRRRWVAVQRLRIERAKLHDAMLALAEGVDLPGRIDDVGRVVPA
jgi:1-acyl-sn-glycerol-3-phosphate acyltransferase